MGDRKLPRADAADPSRTPLRSIQGGQQGVSGVDRSTPARATSFGEPTAAASSGAPELSLPARTSSGQIARRWVMNALAGEGVFGLSNQVVELLTGELVANAALHGPVDGVIRVSASRIGGTVKVAVRDESPLEPVVKPLEPTSLSGRGLALVETLSTQWGIERHGVAGKTVWFSVDLDPERG